ncbi:MAG TPA: DNA polymerase [Terracidiphilus sp.]|nr:DNA polymerase [Terracidiphilus sp.]
MQSLGIDFETFSEVDLKKAGLHNYATDPSTGVHCLSYGPSPADTGSAVEHIKTWVEGEPFPEDLKVHIAQGGIITAWNAAFELAIWNLCCVKKYGWPPLPIRQVRCSMVRAYAMALPGALDDAAPALGVDQRKDAEGHRIMLQLSKPKKDGSMWRREDDLDKFLKLYSYNKQDVRTELACLERLMELSPSETLLWELDYKINNRGVMCDLASVDKGIATIQSEKKLLDGEMLKVTGGVVGSCTEVQLLGKWIKSQGVEMDGLAKADVLNALAGIEEDTHELLDGGTVVITAEGLEIPSSVRRALELRQEAAKSSTAKLIAMREKASADGRIRNLHQFHAASTGRWAGRGIQVQNLPRWRPDIHQSDIEAMLSMLDDKAMLDLFYGPSMAAISDCIRGMLIAGEGNELVACDFSAIEARALAWLAGQESVLEIFRTHGKIYEHAAADVYHVPLDEVTKDQRQRGKVIILACGFGGSIGAFQSMAKNYNVKVPDEEALEIVKAWRAANQKIVSYWRDLEEAVLGAMKNGSVTSAGARGREVKFRKAGSFLWALLPSGRALCYPYPELRMVTTPWGEDKEQLTFMTVVDMTQKKKAKILPDSNSKGKWQRVSTYGGSLAENMTQAIARDLLADAMRAIEAEGIGIVFHVHDEAVAEVQQFRARYVLEHMTALMSVAPAWAAGLPLAAEGWKGKRYRK